MSRTHTFVIQTVYGCDGVRFCQNVFFSEYFLDGKPMPNSTSLTL